MEQEPKVTLLSDEVLKCMAKMFSEAYGQSDDYMNGIVYITIYLTSDSTKYDHILNESIGVSKKLIIQSIFSKFIAINNYRRKMNIPLSLIREEALTSFEKSQDNDYIINPVELMTMLTDTFSLLLNPSPIYEYNVVKELQKTKLIQKIHKTYPLSTLEHITILNKSFTNKEYLFYTLIEIINNNFEKQTFLNDDTPIPDRNFLMSIKELFEKYNGTYQELPNLHKNVCDEFNNRIKSYQDYEYNRVLLIEMLLNIIIGKYRYNKPLSLTEKELIETLKKTNIKEEDLTKFYDLNNQEIITTFINNWYIFPTPTILEDNKSFDLIRKKTK